MIDKYKNNLKRLVDSGNYEMAYELSKGVGLEYYVFNLFFKHSNFNFSSNTILCEVNIKTVSNYLRLYDVTMGFLLEGTSLIKTLELGELLNKELIKVDIIRKHYMKNPPINI